jgi:hypothetical protein
LNDSVASGESVVVTQRFKNLHRGGAVSPGNVSVVFEDLIDHTNPGSQSGPKAMSLYFVWRQRRWRREEIDYSLNCFAGENNLDGRRSSALARILGVNPLSLGSIRLSSHLLPSLRDIFCQYRNNFSCSPALAELHLHGWRYHRAN